jgi:hypothetical protein
MKNLTNNRPAKIRKQEKESADSRKKGTAPADDPPA